MVNAVNLLQNNIFDNAGFDDAKALRQALLRFVAPAAPVAWALFLVTLAVYAGAVYVAGFSAAPLWLRLLASLIAGGTDPVAVRHRP